MKTIQTLSASALAILLVGCGGTPSDPVPTFADLQGIWRSTSDATSPLSAVVLPDGKLWALGGSSTNARLLKGGFTIQGHTVTATATSYALNSGVSTPINLTANVVGKSALNGEIVSPKEPFNLRYQSAYETPAALSDYAGAWKSDLESVVVTWNITAAAGNAVISGTSTTGCTYSGSVTLRSEAKAITDVSIAEVCGGVSKVLAGVGLKNTASTGSSAAGLLMLLTSADDKDAVALSLAK